MFSGIGSGYNNSNGEHNVFGGNGSGFNNTTGNNNTALGDGAGPSIGTLINATALGYNASVSQSNSLVLGGTGTNAVSVGIGTSTPGFTLDVNGNLRCVGAINTTSDARLKQDVRPVGGALAGVMALRGVRYTFRRGQYPALNLPAGEQIGVLAQEVERVYPELVTTDPQGFKAVNYAQLTPVLLEAIKEQQAQLATLKAQNTALQGAVHTLQGQALRAEADHASLQTLQEQVARLLGEVPPGTQARQ